MCKIFLITKEEICLRINLCLLLSEIEANFNLDELAGENITMRKILCALIVLFIFTGCVFADEVSSGDVQEVKRDKSGNIIDMKSPEGLRIVYLGTFRTAPVEALSPDTEPDEGIFSVFMVRSEKDTPLQLDVRDGFDTRTNKFSWRNSAPWGYIADIETNGNPRDILGTFWVRVTFWHDLPFKYGAHPVIARIGFVINNNELTFKRIRPKPYTEWQKIEQKVFELEENETELDFQLDELDNLEPQK